MWARVFLEPANLSPPTFHCLSPCSSDISKEREGQGGRSEPRPGPRTTLEHLRAGKGPGAPVVAGLGCQSLSSASRRSRKGPGCGCHTRHLPEGTFLCSSQLCPAVGPRRSVAIGSLSVGRGAGLLQLWAPFLSGFSCWGLRKEES